MRTILGVKPGEAILFLVCVVIYLVLVMMLWNTGFFGVLPSIADDVYGILPFIKDIQLIGELPAQSVSKLFVATTLYLMASVYAIGSIAISEHRKYLPQFILLAVLTFLGWVSLNFWVISGFLNASLLYGGAAILLLIVWAGAMGRLISQLHDATALFLVRYGLGLACFIAIVQILSLFTPGWRSPTQGIPVLYTVTLNAMVGIILAGSGANMLWRERRQMALAGGRKRR